MPRGFGPNVHSEPEMTRGVRGQLRRSNPEAEVLCEASLRDQNWRDPRIEPPAKEVVTSGSDR